MDLSIFFFARIVLIWLLCLLSVMFHELGHALGYRISGGKAAWRVTVGSGPRLFRVSRFTFGFIPAGGNFVPEEESETDKGLTVTCAGGPFVSLLQAALYWIVYFCVLREIQPGNSIGEFLLPVFSFLFYFNLFQFLFTIIPMRYRIVCRGYESDGLQIIHALKHRKAS